MSSQKHSIVVSLPQHQISVFLDGKEVRPRIRTFSTGRSGYETPLGDFWISSHRRWPMHFSGEFHDSTGRGAAMPFSLFLDKLPPDKGNHHKFEAQPTGTAFHAGDPNVESHGCIHLTESDAQWLFHWVGGHDVHVKIVGPRIGYHHDPQRS